MSNWTDRIKTKAQRETLKHLVEKGVVTPQRGEEALEQPEVTGPGQQDRRSPAGQGMVGRAGCRPVGDVPLQANRLPA